MDNQEIKNGVSGAIHPAVTESESLFQLLTMDQREAQFQEKMSRVDTREVQRIASMMSSNPEYFLKIIGNRDGSFRMRDLFGISAEADVLFCSAILSRFFKIMTDKNAFRVAVRAMAVFGRDQKRMLCEFTLDHLLQIACNRHGRDGVNGIITYCDNPYYKKLLCDKVANKVDSLSYDINGSFVVQKVLEQNDLYATHTISVTLDGSCVDLSFTMPGSFVVEKLLGATSDSMSSVVQELLRCDENKLVRLAMNKFGSFVVHKALRVTREKRNEVNLFEPLVSKLMPFRHRLRDTHGRAIETMLYRYLTS